MHEGDSVGVIDVETAVSAGLHVDESAQLAQGPVGVDMNIEGDEIDLDTQFQEEHARVPRGVWGGVCGV